MMEQSRGKLLVNVLARFVAGFGILLVLVALPAGTFAFWELWVYALTLFLPMSLSMVYLFRKDRALLERRMQVKEPQRAQKWIMTFGTVSYGFGFIICGFDQRWDWSTVPAAAVLVADAIVLVSYLAMLRVMQVNSFASRTIRVEPEQTIVTTGPYALVRHPMYASGLLLYLVTPIGLGSWWGVLAALPMIAVFIARIFNEEKVLLEELPGYREYMQVTRYRLIPHIW